MLFFYLFYLCVIIFFNGKEVKVIHTRAKITFLFFIKNYISTDHDLPVVWIVKFVSFGVVVIADENELLTFVIQYGSTFVWYMYMGNASEYS